MFLTKAVLIQILLAGLRIVMTSGDTAMQTAASNPGFFEWMEVYSTFVDLVKTIIVAGIVSMVWGLHYIREHRAAATFSFYACFRLLLTELQKKLPSKQEGQDNNYRQNPYEALLSKSLRHKLSVQRNETIIKDTDYYLNKYTQIAKRLQDLILSSDNNIYPRKKERDRWYKEQMTVYNFTSMVLEKEGVESVEEEFEVAEIKRNELTSAITFLLEEIEHVKF